MGVSRAAIWAVAGTCIGLVALGLSMTALSVDFSQSTAQLYFAASSVPLVLWRGRVDQAVVRRLIDVFEMVCLFWSISMAGVVASYIVASTSTGFVDETLAAADRSLGFDWLALYAATAAHSGIAWIRRIAYSSIAYTPVILLAALAWSDQPERARRFVLAFAIALDITVVLSYWFPAKSALVHYGTTRTDYMPAVNFVHVDIMESLRDGTMTRIDIANLWGLITFPSFHAACAVMFIWASWSLRRLRWPVTAVNLAMLAATPIEGTHYLIDILGGFAVAAFAIMVVRSDPRALISLLRRPQPALA